MLKTAIIGSLFDWGVAQMFIYQSYRPKLPPNETTDVLPPFRKKKWNPTFFSERRKYPF